MADIAEFIELGTQIVTQGQKLTELRARRDAVLAEIAAVEKDLAPLLVRHSSAMAALSGLALPSPAQPQAVFSPVQGGPPQVPGASAPTGDAASQLLLLEKKVMAFLSKAEAGVGPQEIAQAIGENEARVREVMMTLHMRRARGNAALEVDPS